MITFPPAPTVAPGDQITSTQLSGLAAAFNKRLRSGIADGAQRLAYYSRNAFLSVTNPSGDTWSPQAEFMLDRQMLEPDVAPWPAGDPGEYGGPNVASLWPAYVYGAEAIGLDPEAIRLTDPIYGLTVNAPGPTVADRWALGKLQRGAYDPWTGAVACPAFTAARAYSAIRWRWWSPHGSSWGGYFPTPELLGTACEDPIASDLYPAPPNFNLFFTSLVDGSTKSYAGTCQDGPDISTPGMYDLHVYAWGETPWAWFVLLNDGTLDELARSEWVVGPFTGEPYLSRAWGNHLERAMHRFSGEFRGVEPNEQAMRGRSTQKYRLAPDFARIVRQQYLLAPQRGVQAGNSITAAYQTVDIPAGGESGTLTAEAGCVFAAFLVTGASGASVSILDAAGGPLAQAGAAPDGQVTTLHPTATAIRFRSVGGAVSVEVAELLDYRPAPWDIFLLMRVGSARI